VTKVTLDDVEYDLDNFTEDQKNLLREINFNNTLSTNLKYQLSSLKVVADLLVDKLKKSLKEEASNDD
tara:strand:- start:287 stop:490 length:204 start_codon:yes stop_codon:yes gene_type:complete